MKRAITLIAALLVLVCHLAYAQQIKNVTPGLNTLADAVNSSNAGDVLVLQRSAGYPNQGIINVSVPITIKAADGAGERPVIAVAPDAAGVYAGTVFGLYANTRFENLAFTGIRNPQDRAQRIGQAFQLFEVNLRVVVQGCSFTGFGGRTLEAGRDGVVLIIKDCIETGNGRSNRVDNGRFIDFRDANADSLIMQNNTLLNCADRWIRHMLLDASLNYAFIDHNTFMNGTGYRPSFQFRNVKKLYFTNNIVANPSILGTTQSGVRKDELEYVKSEGVCTFTIAGADTSNEVLIMRDNNAWRDPRIDAILGGLDLANGDSVQIAPWFNSEFEERIDPARAFFSEPLSFVKDVTIDSILPELQIYVSGSKGYSHSAFIFRTDEYATGVDMSYGTTARSYTAAAGGFPLGDLNWYPDRKAAWVAAGMPTSVDDAVTGVPTTFELSQNHPNPFNPQTQIAYNLPVAARVSLEIYNALGQKVRTLVQEHQPGGSHRVTWDGKSDLGTAVPSGLYFYRLRAGSQTMLRKMMLLK